MPIYIYICKRCCHEFEIFLEAPVVHATCPKCSTLDTMRKSYFQACSWTTPEDVGKGT